MAMLSHVCQPQSLGAFWLFSLSAAFFSSTISNLVQRILLAKNSPLVRPSTPVNTSCECYQKQLRFGSFICEKIAADRGLRRKACVFGPSASSRQGLQAASKPWNMISVPPTRGHTVLLTSNFTASIFTFPLIWLPDARGQLSRQETRYPSIRGRDTVEACRTASALEADRDGRQTVLRAFSSNALCCNREHEH